MVYNAWNGLTASLETGKADPLDQLDVTKDKSAHFLGRLEGPSGPPSFGRLTEVIVLIDVARDVVEWAWSRWSSSLYSNVVTVCSFYVRDPSLPPPPKMSLHLLSALRRCTITSNASQNSLLRSTLSNQTRLAMKFAPTFVRHPRVHKGRVPIPTGGSIKGTTLNHGEYGIRIRGDGMRITAKQLQAAETVIKRKLKVIKGAKIWMRVFPDMPVCVKVSMHC